MAMDFALAQLRSICLSGNLESCRFRTKLEAERDHQYQTKKAFCELYLFGRGVIVLSITDFIGCSNLYECEVEAIAEHEHVPMAVAVVIGEGLLCSPDGICCLHRMVAEDIQHALDCNDLDKALKFADTYKFIESKHPLPLH
jgi:hypothetical protein